MRGIPGHWWLGALGAVAGIAFLLLGFLPLYAGAGLIQADGLLSRIVPVYTLLMLGAAIVTPVWVIGRMRGWQEGRERARRMQALERGWRALAADPQLSRWLPLARRYYSVDPALLQGWEQRYQQLLADPRRSAHAARCLDGWFPTDDEIDYADDPTATRCCEHLQAVERDLRANGFRCGPRGPRMIWTAARIADLDALRRDYRLGPGIGYDEDERGPHQGALQRLYCHACASAIEFQMGRPFPR